LSAQPPSHFRTILGRQQQREPTAEGDAGAEPACALREARNARSAAL
jgi:hypothetical protein